MGRLILHGCFVDFVFHKVIYDGGEPIKVDGDVTSILSVDSRCDNIKFD